MARYRLSHFAVSTCHPYVATSLATSRLEATTLEGINPLPHPSVSTSGCRVESESVCGGISCEMVFPAGCDSDVPQFLAGHVVGTWCHVYGTNSCAGVGSPIVK